MKEGEVGKEQNPFEEVPALRRFVSSRERSSGEVSLYLRRKGMTSSDQVAGALETLKTLGFVDDRRFAENRAHYRFEHGFGPVYVREELLRLRIDRSIVDEVLAAREESHLEEAFAAAEKRLPRVLQEIDASMRLTQYLLRRGFTRDQAQKALHRLREKYPHWGRRRSPDED